MKEVLLLKIIKNEYDDMFFSLVDKYRENDVKRVSFAYGLSFWDSEEVVMTAYQRLHDDLSGGKVSASNVTHLHRIAVNRCHSSYVDHMRTITARKFVKAVPVEPEDLDYTLNTEGIRSTRQTLVLLSTKKSIGSARQELLTDTFRLFCKTDTDKMFAEVLMKMVHANETSSFDCTEVARQCHILYELTGALDSTRRKVSRFFERLRVFISENRNFVEDYRCLTALLA